MAAPRGNKFASRERRGRTPLERFLSYCRFEPETGCVLWIGAQTSGRGHYVPYGSFWFEGRSWFAHRWAARYIKGLAIDDLHVDHCCSDVVPSLTHPNTLCVEHVQALTLGANRELQTTRAFEARKTAIHLEVGILRYEDVYGYAPSAPILLPETPPFYTPPSWLPQGPSHDHSATAACPF